MPSQALDQAAKRMGFRDYATYQAYQNQQRIMREGPAVVGVGTQGQPQHPQQAPANAPPENWLQRLGYGD
jgi:hypothetical protein